MRYSLWNDSESVRSAHNRSISRENRHIVADEPVEFEKWPVEVQDFRKFTDHFRGIYRIYIKVLKKTRKMSTCNRLDSNTFGCFGSVMLRFSPNTAIDEWFSLESVVFHKVYQGLSSLESAIFHKVYMSSTTNPSSKRREHSQQLPCAFPSTYIGFHHNFTSMSMSELVMSHKWIE